ncbi:MAG: AAA family ATPase [Holosporales bacterium]|jgi:predicted ATP-binding protein involved in virulence|nr:AAA family ATPase [Holosporales bacterium]
MRLINLKINGLFDLFSYSIDLNQDEELTILTGPNGYGKTTVLNILYSLFNSRFYYFQKLVFKEIIFHFDNGYRLEVKKLVDDIMEYETLPKGKISIDLYAQSGSNIGTYEYTAEKEEGIKNQILKYLPFLNKLPDNRWLDGQMNRVFNFEELLYEYSDTILNNVFDSFENYGIQDENLLEILNTFSVYLIKEQRLIRQYKSAPYVSTIQEYAKELSNLIRDKQVESLNITQLLDSSFPKRLLNSTDKLSEQAFVERFESLKKKYEKLQKFGLLTTSPDVPPYNDSAENARVLTVYLSDSEQKTAVFDDLLDKIELFTNILNQKRFTFKSIHIDKDNGFVFKTINGQPLSLTDLSSGEQHEVVLLYELLFKVQPNTLVLIDEPEISLHVSWQHAFIEDLIKIAKMQKIRFIIATHSPMIINNRFDLSVDLFALTQSKDEYVNS